MWKPSKPLPQYFIPILTWVETQPLKWGQQFTQAGLQIIKDERLFDQSLVSKVVSFLFLEMSFPR